MIRINKITYVLDDLLKQSQAKTIAGGLDFYHRSSMSAMFSLFKIEHFLMTDYVLLTLTIEKFLV